MNSTITCEGIITQDQYSKLCIEIYYRKPLSVFATVFSLGLIIFWSVLLSFYGNQNTYTVLFVIAFTIYTLVKPILIYFNAKKYFSSNKNLQENIRYDFSADKIVVKATTFGGEKNWDNLHKIDELKNYFLFYQDIRLMSIIPKRNFKNDTDVNRLRDLIRSKKNLKQHLRND